MITSKSLHITVFGVPKEDHMKNCVLYNDLTLLLTLRFLLYEKKIFKCNLTWKSTNEDKKIEKKTSLHIEKKAGKVQQKMVINGFSISCPDTLSNTSEY